MRPFCNSTVPIPYIKFVSTLKWSTLLQNTDPRRRKIKKIMFLQSRDVLFGVLEASAGVYRGIKTQSRKRAKLLLQSSELGLPQTLPAGECAPPPL
jgi:hypothetical protein